MGIISGYPTGAKIAVNFREKEICTKEQAERLIAFTNNSGPLFIIGTIGISMFGSAKIGYILLISHILSCFIVGILFKNWKKEKENKFTFLANNVESSKEIHLKDIGEILGNAIKKSISTILNIGGFIVIFSVIISILESSGVIYVLQSTFGDVEAAAFSGIIEITNGINEISILGKSNLHIILTSFILGFGGISVLFQVYSVIAKSDISIKPYILGKFIQAVISSIITALIVCNWGI